MIEIYIVKFPSIFPFKIFCNFLRVWEFLVFTWAKINVVGASICLVTNFSSSHSYFTWICHLHYGRYRLGIILGETADGFWLNVWDFRRWCAYFWAYTEGEWIIGRDTRLLLSTKVCDIILHSFIRKKNLWWFSFSCNLSL